MGIRMVVCLLLLCLASGCGKNPVSPEDSLVGTWRQVKEAGVPVCDMLHLTLGADGIYHLHEAGKLLYTGSWENDENRLVFNGELAESCYYRIAGNFLTLSWDEEFSEAKSSLYQRL